MKPTPITTPIGISSWCAINPDSPDTKYEHQWFVDLVVDPNDPKVKAFIETTKKFYNDARQHFGAQIGTNPLPIKDELDADKNPTGMLVIKCKRKVGGIRKDGSPWTNTLPVLYDANVQPFTPSGSIGKGSKMRIALNMKPYGAPKVGVTFEIVSVQILDVQYYGNDATPEAFEVEQGSNTPTPELTPDSISSASEGGDSFSF